MKNVDLVYKHCLFCAVFSLLLRKGANKNNSSVLSDCVYGGLFSLFGKRSWLRHYARRSRVRLPIRSLDISVGLILPAAL